MQKDVSQESGSHFEQVCEAGAGLLVMIAKYLEKFGLTPGDAPGVLAIASAGMLMVEDLDHNEYVKNIGIIIESGIWKDDGQGRIVFDPPHQN